MEYSACGHLKKCPVLCFMAREICFVALKQLKLLPGYTGFIFLLAILLSVDVMDVAAGLLCCTGSCGLS